MGDADGDETPLTTIYGIGGQTAAELSRAGFSTAEALAISTGRRVARKTALSTSRAQDLVDRARDLTGCSPADRINGDTNESVSASDRRVYLCAIIKQLEGQRGASVASIIERAVEDGMDQDTVEQTLKTLKVRDEVYEPVPNRLRVRG